MHRSHTLHHLLHHLLHDDLLLGLHLRHHALHGLLRDMSNRLQEFRRLQEGNLCSLRGFGSLLLDLGGCESRRRGSGVGLWLS